MTYTAFNGRIARLCGAISKDLINWTKHGLAFGKVNNGKYKNLWSKSGSIICKQINGKLVGTKINVKYFIYWGESDIYMATSENLVDWEPVSKEVKTGKSFTAFLGNGRYQVKYEPSTFTFKSALSTRNGKFDAGLVEPGPAATLTKGGYFLFTMQLIPKLLATLP